MRASLIAVCVTLVSAGCGDDSPADGSGGAGGSTTSSTQTTTTTTSSASTTASVTTGAGGGSAEMSAIITDVLLYANCMPVVGPDPVAGSVFVSYPNAGTIPGHLDVKTASLLFANPMEAWSFPLAFDPVSSGQVGAGDSLVVEHTKIPNVGDSSFICQLCGMPGTLTMSFDRGDGEGPTATFPFDLDCAF